MKLYTSLTSPYGRKCRMVAIVAGVQAQVDVTDIDYKTAQYRDINPLNKVPALGRDDGSILIDSPVISAFIARQGDEHAVYPKDEEARWQTLCLEALADGITDAGVAIFMENKRAEEKRSHGVLEQQTNKINAGLDAIEAVAVEFGDSTAIGVLAVAACVSWLEFRSIVDGVRENRPHLSAWLERIADTEYMTASAPPPGA